MTTLCYHCNRPVPSGMELSVCINGATRLMCCAGCVAVAQLIADIGKTAYYTRRTAFPENPESFVWEPPNTEDIAAATACIQRDPDGGAELSLSLPGLACSACAWLVESALQQQRGVLSQYYDFSKGLVQLRVDPERLDIVALLAAVRRIGYNPVPCVPGADEAERRREIRRELKGLGVAGIGMMQVLMYAIGLYAGAFDGIGEGFRLMLQWASCIVATPVVLYAAAPFFRNAIISLRAWWQRGLRSFGCLSMDVPVALAIGSAWSASLFNMVKGTGDLYFDSAVMFTFLLLAGRFLEKQLRHRVFSGVDELAASVRELEVERDGHRILCKQAQLRRDDRVRVSPGSMVPADGRILHGATQLDMSRFTGEAMPVGAGPGDRVFAGAVNLDRQFQMHVEAAGADTELAALGRLTRRALADKPQWLSLADLWAGRIVLVVLMLAGSGWLAWQLIDPGQAFPVALAVLVATCPCALALATPMVLSSAMIVLQRLGLFPLRGDVVESLGNLNLLIFDKTGTLTEGRPLVTEVRLGDVRPPTGDTWTQEFALAVAAGLESGIEHPLARAFTDHEQQSAVRCTMDDRMLVAGRGVQASWQCRDVRLGTADFAGVGPIQDAPDDVMAPCCWLYLSMAGRFAAAFRLRDDPRPGVPAALVALLEQGFDLLVASGDTRENCRWLRALHPDLQIHAGLTPAAKLQLLGRLQATGARVGVVGDGLNDGPMLAGADLGIALESGVDLARSQADAILMGGSMTALPKALRLGILARKIIKQNLCWAACYNLSILPLALAAVLPPWLAALGMSCSSLIVVINSLRLFRSLPEPWKNACPGQASALASGV